MTVIAWDGRMVAADSLITVGDTRVGHADKVVLKRFRDGSALYAATGPDGWLEAWIAWDVAGQIPGDRPITALPPHRTGVIIRWMDGECHSISPEHPYWTKCDWPDAWGSGADFAIGAMEAGADALGACTIAVKRSTGCGGFVQVWYTKHPADMKDSPRFVAHERCICDECHAHFSTPETQTVADFVATASEVLKAGQEQANCLTAALVGCGEGVGAPAKAEQPWAERVAERERRAEALQRSVPEPDARIAQSHTAASGMRLHMEKMATLAARRCDHGYLSHTCSACAPEARALLELALRPNGRG